MSLIPKGGNDRVMTPPALAKAIVKEVYPVGLVLEPCRGTGNIFKELPQGAEWCEIDEGKDFFKWTEKVDWIVTNPPFSQWRKFLKHSMEVAEVGIAFLCTINHLWLKARMRDIREAGWQIQSIYTIDGPIEGWPQSGFQVGVIVLRKVNMVVGGSCYIGPLKGYSQ